MRKTFIPYNFERLLFQKLHNIRQGKCSVEYYSNEFYQMLTRVDINDSEDQLVARFIAGLRPQLQTMLHQFDPSSISESRQRALLLEQQSANSWTWNTRPHSNTITDDTKKKSSGTETTTTTQGNNRTTKPVTGTANTRPARPNSLLCYTCGETGHRQTACPNSGRRGLLANDRELVGDPIYDTEDGRFDDVEEEELNGDTRTLLMLRRNCFGPKTSEAWQ